MAGHIVWDWNGTLFDDHDIVYQASAEMFAQHGLPPVTLERYRAAYTRPISMFYRRLFGVAPTAEQLASMEERFHDNYRRAVRSTELTAGAREVLAGWRAGGGTQSLLSMYRHEALLPLVRKHGIEAEFVRIDGLPPSPAARAGAELAEEELDAAGLDAAELDEGGGGRKAEYLRRHLAALEGCLPGPVRARHVVVIGDSVDDAVAAAAMSVACVLYNGGSHPRAELAAVAVPVADTLQEALRWASSFG